MTDQDRPNRDTNELIRRRWSRNTVTVDILPRDPNAEAMNTWIRGQRDERHVAATVDELLPKETDRA